MAGVVDQRGQRFVLERIEIDHEHVAITGTFGVDAEESFASRRDCPSIRIYAAFAASGADSDRLKSSHGFGRRFG